MNGFFGHLGRGHALEFHLSMLKLGIGITLIFSDLSEKSPATFDLAWYYSKSVIACPFLILGTTQLCGWFLNWYRSDANRPVREAAAIMAMLVWSTIAVKTSWIGDSTFLYPLVFVCFPSSLFLLWRARTTPLYSTIADNEVSGKR